MTVSFLETPIWRDGHLHLRQLVGEGELLPALASFSRPWCSEVVVMPNPDPPICTAEDVYRYKAECEDHLGPTCKPLITIKLTPDTTPKIIREAKKAGAVGVKVYPEGVTTGSGGASSLPGHIVKALVENEAHKKQITREMLVSPPVWLLENFETMQGEDMVYLNHGELPGVFSMDRETAYLPVFMNIARQFPKMRMTLEHITTEAAVNCIDLLASEGLPVRATLTMHHAWMRNGLDDVLGGLLDTAKFCKPIAKRPDPDWIALIRSIKQPWVFLGTDSAAHPIWKKHARRCCAGCFTAGHPEMLLDLFEEFNLMDHLVPFTSERMGEFYRLPPSPLKIGFKREAWKVPEQMAGIDTFLGGETLGWKLQAA